MYSKNFDFLNIQIILKKTFKFLRKFRYWLSCFSKVSRANRLQTDPLNSICTSISYEGIAHLFWLSYLRHACSPRRRSVACPFSLSRTTSRAVVNHIFNGPSVKCSWSVAQLWHFDCAIIEIHLKGAGHAFPICIRRGQKDTQRLPLRKTKRHRTRWDYD